MLSMWHSALYSKEKTIMKNLKLTMIVGLCLIVLSINTMADIAIITSANNDMGSLTSKDVKKIFLGKSNKMNPVDQTEGSDIRNAFYSKVTGKNKSKMKAYWSKMIFSGKATPPVASTDDSAIKSWVNKNKKAIGYIDSSAVDSSVKVLLTVK